jgi:hypothetical protein
VQPNNGEEREDDDMASDIVASDDDDEDDDDDDDDEQANNDDKPKSNAAAHRHAAPLAPAMKLSATLVDSLQKLLDNAASERGALVQKTALVGLVQHVALRLRIDPAEAVDILNVCAI